MYVEQNEYGTDVHVQFQIVDRLLIDLTWSREHSHYRHANGTECQVVEKRNGGVEGVADHAAEHKEPSVNYCPQEGPCETDQV